MKFPTIKEMVEEVAEKALDEYEYKGKTLRQWIEIIAAFELSTNLAEVGMELISRAAAQTELQLSARRYTVAHEAHGEGRVVWSEDLISVSDAMDVLRKIPSAQPTFDARDTQYNLPIGTDYISRQQAITALAYAKETGTMKCGELKGVIEVLNKVPSAQPEIIRCRECKFASGDSRICMKFDHSPIGELDFCSFAERREVTI